MVDREKQRLQQEHIQAIREGNVAFSARTKKIQNLYLNYQNNPTEDHFTELLETVDAYCKGRTLTRLSNAGYYTKDNCDEVMQIAHIDLWKELEKARSRGTVIERFAAFAFQIYMRTAFDFVAGQRNELKKYNYIFVDEDTGEDGPSKMDLLPPSPGAEDELAEERIVLTDLFVLYCETLVSENAFPPRSLALYYARLLPHMLPGSGVPDTKGASAKWACIRMGNRTVGALSMDSEEYLQSNVASHLKWCPEYYAQLQESTGKPGEGLLEDLVYTSRYDKRTIEDWSESMHKTVTKNMVLFIRSDRKLMANCADYISSRDRLYKLIFDEDSPIGKKRRGRKKRPDTKRTQEER